MMKKLFAGGVVAALLAIGAASATSLGLDDGDAALAVDVVGLAGCTADDVSLTTVIEADADTQPVQVYVGDVTISGLSPECEGHQLGLQFIRDDNGKDKQMGFVVGPVIGNTGSETVGVHPTKRGTEVGAKRHLAELVTKVVVVVEN